MFETISVGRNTTQEDYEHWKNYIRKNFFIGFTFELVFADNLFQQSNVKRYGVMLVEWNDKRYWFVKVLFCSSKKL